MRDHGVRARIALLLLLLGGALFLAAGSASAAVGDGIPAHSHWDDPNADYEIDFCLVVEKVPGSGTISYIPFREVDARNYMALHMTTTGLKLETRIDGQSYYSGSPLAATLVYHDSSAPATYGVNDEFMIDFVAQGDDYTAYRVLPDGSRKMLDQWHDSSNAGHAKYTQGVNVSYYTNPGYKARWEDVKAFPLAGSPGVGHTIEDLDQDASTSTQQCNTTAYKDVTHDDEAPANGNVDHTGTGALNGQTTINWGLPSSTRYEYKFHVTGIAGTGAYFDYRDPQSPVNSYYKMGWYRFKPGYGSTPPTIERWSQVWDASQPCVPPTASPVKIAIADQTLVPGTTGGDADYTLDLVGDTQYLYKNGNLVLTSRDVGPQSGVRVRLRPVGSEDWSWSGHQYAVPKNTTAPAISGSPVQGQTLAADTGTWDATPAPRSFAYKWRRCDSAGANCIDVGTGGTYVVQSADVGKRLLVAVTATNDEGSATAESSATPAVTASGSGPRLVNATQQNNAAGNPSETIAIPATAAGDDLVVLVSQAAASTAAPFTATAGSTALTTPPTVTKTNGPPPVDFVTGANSYTSASYALNVPAGITSVTINWAAGSTSKANSILVTEWSGVSSVDASVAGGGTASLATQTASPLTTTGQDAIIGSIETATTVSLDPASSGWTALPPGTQGANHSAAAYRIGAAGSYAPTWALGAAKPAGMVGIALK